MISQQNLCLIDISDPVEHNFSRAVLSTGITGTTSGTTIKAICNDVLDLALMGGGGVVDMK